MNTEELKDKHIKETTDLVNEFLGDIVILADETRESGKLNHERLNLIAKKLANTFGLVYNQGCMMGIKTLEEEMLRNAKRSDS